MGASQKLGGFALQAPAEAGGAAPADTGAGATWWF